MPFRSLTYFLLSLLQSPVLMIAWFKLLFSVQVDFFLPQTLARFGLRKRPVKKVDQDLDDTIPFLPKFLGKYLSFFGLWVCALGYFRKQCGKKAIPGMIVFLNGLRQLYINSGLVYKVVQTTTKRPPGFVSPRFALIRLTDPHLCCVPSLHVTVVCFTYIQVKSLLTELGCKEQHNDFIDFLYKEACLIIDTIVLIKQHSINCVAAGLFFMVKQHPDFTFEKGSRIIDSFLGNSGLALSSANEIRDYVTAKYRELFDQCGQDNAVSFLIEYLLQDKLAGPRFP